MFKLLLPIVFAVVTASAEDENSAVHQLMNFKKATKDPGVLTYSSGAPVDIESISSSLNQQVISNEPLMEMLMHFDHEIIPERPAHAQGTGAFGYFEVTNDVSNICKADFLSKIGKKTPVACRFSSTGPSRGADEFPRETRGFACKFYTDEGNWDFAGLNSEMFSVKDPLLTQTLVHVSKRNPSTNFPDTNQFWDFALLHKESFLRLLFAMSEYGLSDGYQHMPGHGIHTMELYNKEGEKFACKIDFQPCMGLKNINSTEAKRLSAIEPLYFSKSLYNLIEQHNYPSWEMSFRCLNEAEVKKAGHEIYDITKYKFWHKIKPIPVGILKLDRNYINYFADIEKLAFCPGTKVPGMMGSPDQLFLARTFSYKDTQIGRLGVNFEQIEVNRPKTKVLTYNRDGVAPNGDNGGAAPWYYPNSFNGPQPVVEKNRPKLSVIHEDPPNNMEDTRYFYNDVLNKDQRKVVISNLCENLRPVENILKDEVVKYLCVIDKDLGKSVKKCLKS